MSKIKQTIAIFGAGIGLCACLLPFSTYADTQVVTTFNDISVTIEDYLELSVVANSPGTDVTYESGTYSSTMLNGAAKSDFGTTSLSATCNNEHGWKLQAQSVTKNGSGYATMEGQNTDLQIASDTTTLNGSVSTWTMRVAPSTGVSVTPEFASTHIIPSSATTISTGSYGTSKLTDVTYGVGISYTQAADTYSGSVTYTLLPNS